MSETGDESDKPLFLRAQDPSTWEKPEDVSWGDHFLRPDKPLKARHKLIAKMAASGATTTEIATKLNYTVSRISILLSNTRIKAEIEKLQDKMFEADLDTRMKELAPEALDVIEEIISSDTMTAAKKENAARWLLEKVSGKAAQQIDLKGDISVGVFLDKLDQLKATGQVIDVTPKPQLPVSEQSEKLAEATESPAADPLLEWVNQNLVK